MPDTPALSMTTRRLIALAVLAVIVVIAQHQTLFFSHTLTLTVVRNDAPEVCVRSRSILVGAKRRSSVPEFEYEGYCGSIQTDLGYYKLPDTGDYLSVYQSRKSLQARLKEGCRYTVRITGYGGAFQVGDRQRSPIQQRITRILSEEGCG